jgi:hypothetical protein
MRNPTKGLALLCLYSFLAVTVFAQSQKQTKTLHFKPPSNINGLTPVQVNFSYKVVNVFGSILLIGDASCTGDLMYQYKGREFTFSGSDAAVRNVRVKDPVIRVSVTGPGGFSKEMTVGIVSGMGGGALFGNSFPIKEAKTKEEKDAANYTVTPIQVNSVSYDGGWDVQKLLDEKLRNEQKAVDIKSFIDNGDKAMRQQNYAEAESNYFKAQRLDKDNQYAAIQLEKIKTEKTKVQSKKNYDDLMSAAKSAEQSGDIENAERLYRKAAASGVNDAYARNEASRMTDAKERKAKELEDKINKMNEKAEKDEKVKKELNDKQVAETNKLLKEKEDYNKKLLQQKADSVAASVAEADRIKLDEQRKKAIKDQEEETKRVEKAEEESNAKEASERRSSDDKMLSRFEKNMAYDPEKYYESLEAANKLMSAAFAIKPWDELQLKREWWDNNPYIQLFADDLYEKQRRQNHWNYMKKQSEVEGAIYTAKYAFADAVQYVDRGSKQHKYLLSRIESCNKHIDFHKKAWKADFKGENNRIKFREQAKTMAIVNTMVNDNSKAMLAYDVLGQSAEEPAKYLVKKYELAERFQQAEQNYVKDMAIAGVTNSVAISAILNDKEVALVNKAMVMNAFVSIGGGTIPMLMNETSDVNTPQTTISNMGVGITTAGIDWWVYRSHFIDANIGGFAGFGIWPSKGQSAYYLNYGGKLNLDIGFTRVKLANTFEYVTRTGSQKIDHDVWQASNTNYAGSATNRIGEGKFNYTVMKVGTGLKIDLNDGYTPSHLWFNVFAEKPSFYPESIFTNPVFSYQFEWMSRSNMAINIAYSNNYVIAGEKKYPIADKKNAAFFHFQFGKYWTIAK